MKILTILSALFVTISLSSVSALAKEPPYFPSVTLSVASDQIGPDECVTRIDPPSETAYVYNWAGQIEASLASYLIDFQTRGGDQKLVSEARKKMTIPFVVQNKAGQLLNRNTVVQAIVSPVKEANTDASALSLGSLIPFADDVDATLGGIPNVLNGIINGAISRWNSVVNGAKNSREAKATLTVSEVTEGRIQSALEIVGDAQGVLLAQYACPSVNVDSYSQSLATYLNKLSSAFASLKSTGTR